MKSSVILICLMLILAANSNTQRKDKPIKVSYIVESEHEPQNDLITIVMKFKLFDPSLEEAYLAAHKLLADIQEVITNFCEDNKQEEDESCDGIFQQGQFEIEPIYQRFRGVQAFQKFSLSFDVILHVHSTDNIGSLVDHLVIKKKAIIEEMKWQELQSENQQNLMQKGMAHGIQTCQNLGLKLKKIENIEIVEVEKVSRPIPEEPEGEEEQEQEEAPEEEIEGIIELRATDFNAKYRFSVLCASQ